MLVPLELIDRYGRTFVDFWRLRPRKFYPSIEENPSAYVSPMQFLAISLGIAFVMGVVAITLSFSELESASGSKPIGDPRALAGRLIVFIFFMLIVATLLYRILCALWPIRGRASFLQIFEHQCFMMAVILPSSALDVLINPLVTGLVAKDLVPPWAAFVPFLLGFLIGQITVFLYQVPGAAYVCGVTTLRFWMGLLFWCASIGFLVGIIAVVVL